MPAYFKFLTIMAFHVFIKENVDVAIVEVGIGGLYDCTNVIRWMLLIYLMFLSYWLRPLLFCLLRKPSVVGISSLGLDHVSLLGDTVEKIAAHKAGIMKFGVPTYTVLDQPGDSLSVIVENAYSLQVPMRKLQLRKLCLWFIFFLSLPFTQCQHLTSTNGHLIK